MTTTGVFAMPFGKFKGRALTETPRPYLEWLLANVDLRPDTREVIETFLGLAPTLPPGHQDRAPGEAPPPRRQRSAPKPKDAPPAATCAHCGLGGTTERPLVHASCVSDEVPF